jgi:dipeptidyl aminopeptidase/acylaminoacyl peptidase
MRGSILCLVLAACAIAPGPLQPGAASVAQNAAYQLPSEDYESFVLQAEANFPGPFDNAAFRRDHPLEDWQRLHASSGIEAATIYYRVDGLRITGAIVRPSSGSRHPILIWSRGGVGRAQIDAPQMVEMGWWAARGYTVVASNFRGAGGSKGEDEFAGDDVNDLAALAEIASQLSGVDPQRMYGIGFSRGGLMLYRAAAEGMPLRAFATAGAPTDLATLAQERPDLNELFQRMMPDYADEQANRFCRRSPRCWPERIEAPVLIAHGSADRAIPANQAHVLAQALTSANKPHRLYIVEEADHGLSGARRAFFEAAYDYFQTH